ncbi:MAG: hypothetical protein PT120_24980 [Aphanizomenon gracile PMC649.10]|nr:hypothetical protein [Aphanizomenon gracile PMC649.10]
MSILTETQKRELQTVPPYLKGLPPDDLKFLLPGNRNFHVQSWQILGNALDAFFSDMPNPIPHLENVSEDFKKEMQSWVDHYLNLSILIFKTEHLIIEEAKNRGCDLSHLKRSDMIKRIAWEECCLKIEISNAKYYESLNKRQNEERTREVIKLFAKGEINETTKNRLLEEDEKVSRLHSQNFGQELYFTAICREVFKQQRDLPEAKKFASLGKNSTFKKFLVVDGVIHEIPGRSKDKQPRKKSGS